MANEQERSQWQATACSVAGQVNELVKSWLEDPDETFETKLRIATQRSARMERETDMTKDPALTRQAGILSGTVETLQRLLRERYRRTAIETNCSDPLRMKIMQELNDADRPIRHGDLAERLGMGYDDLIEPMKMLILHEAVQAYRTGRNTRYELSRTARRFIRDADLDLNRDGT